MMLGSGPRDRLLVIDQIKAGLLISIDFRVREEKENVNDEENDKPCLGSSGSYHAFSHRCWIRNRVFYRRRFTTAHVWPGYTVGIAVIVCIIWGFVRPKHARLIDFIYGPAAVVFYLLDLLRSRSKRCIGHSPAGGAMVIVLLFCLVSTVITGLALYGARERRDHCERCMRLRLTSSVLPERGLVFIAVADENGRERRDAADEKESVLKEYHEVLANITLGLVIIHIMAVDLAWSMVTGRKRAE